MARTTPTYTPFGKYALAIIVSFSLLISDINYQTFSTARGFVQATGIYGQLFINSFTINIEKFNAIYQDKQILIKVNKDLKSELLILQNKIFLEKNSQVLANDLLNLHDETLALSRGEEALIFQIASFDLKNYLCCSSHSLYLKNPQKLQVAVNLPVANGDTFIGQTSSLDLNLIKVILFSDSAHILPVKIKNFFCNARGAGKPLLISCRVNKSSEFLKIQNNDPVLTSGLGGIFPRDIPIGKVININNSILNESEIIIALNANPQKSNYFGVLVN